MKLCKLSILILFLNLGFVEAQDSEACPCCSADYRAFDFWLGDWTVYDTKGQLLGTNKVLNIQDGCVLQENWKGTTGSNGTSYNFFDANENTWYQVWISNTGNILKLKGNLDAKGAMVLTSEIVQSPKGDFYNQIKWFKNKDGTVTQLWLILDEKGKITSTLFEGVYKLD